MKKKGVSPVVATVILIVIVIILAIIVFLWARGFVAEKAQKEGRAVELSCDEVNIEAGVFYNDQTSGYDLEIVNRGDIPLYGVEVKEIGSAEVLVRETAIGAVYAGDAAVIGLGSGFNAGDELLLVPVILGEIDSGKVAFTCPDEKGFGTFVP